MKWLRREATLNNLNPMIDDVLKGVGKSIELSKKKYMEIRLICEEVLLNIISYSYPNGKGEMIAGYEFKSDEDCIILKLCDYGKEFNIMNEKEPDITLDIMERDIGGLGILLIKRVSDSVEYERRENMNILTVKKYCS